MFLKFKTDANYHFRDCTGSNRQHSSIEEKLYINLSTIFLLTTEKLVIKYETRTLRDEGKLSLEARARFF